MKSFAGLVAILVVVSTARGDETDDEPWEIQARVVDEQGRPWWKCARWPATETLGPGTRALPGGASMSWISQTVERRPPPPRVVLYRGIISTAGLIGVWIEGKGVARRFRSRN